MSLQTLAELGRVLVVFLPALGGVFCRELLARIESVRLEVEHKGVRLALVHMGDDDEARAELERYELQYVARVADPERVLHRHFELAEAGALQHFRPTVIGRAIGAARHGRGHVVGSGNQLHGAVLLEGDHEPRVQRATARGESLDLMALVD